MHYLVSQGNLNKTMKKEDLLTMFLADMIHDYEHPGYVNQFVVRTKHPLAIRYNDISVLENHHIAAAFQIINSDENNFFKQLSLDNPNLYYSIRKNII
jgi:hypothetical protein